MGRWERCGQVKVVVKIESEEDMLVLQVKVLLSCFFFCETSCILTVLKLVFQDPNIIQDEHEQKIIPHPKIVSSFGELMTLFSKSGTIGTYMV